MQVACGDCVGCCTSAYSIKVRAHETAALKHIPRERLLPAPGEPGTLLMAPDASGHCPMFGTTGCSIYSHRPETCKTYDCRIFSAAGMAAGPDRSAINERVARWRFEYPGDADREEHRAVKAAAGFLRQHPVRFPNGRIPSRPSEVAVLAVKAYRVFLGGSPGDAAASAGIIDACRAFDAGV